MEKRYDSLAEVDVEYIRFYAESFIFMHAAYISANKLLQQSVTPFHIKKLRNECFQIANKRYNEYVATNFSAKGLKDIDRLVKIQVDDLMDEDSFYRGWSVA